MKFKKLSIFFLLLSSFLTNNVYSKVIELEQCFSPPKKFNPEIHEVYSFIIDYNKSIVAMVIIITDNHFNIKKKEQIRKFGSAPFLKKFTRKEFSIENFGDEKVKAIREDKFTKSGKAVTTFLEIDLSKNTVTASYDFSDKKVLKKCLRN